MERDEEVVEMVMVMVMAMVMVMVIVMVLVYIICNISADLALYAYYIYNLTFCIIFVFNIFMMLVNVVS